MLHSLLPGLGLAADDKPCVGVSGCLLGRPVRYDGEHRREALVADLLPRLVEVRELCPEVGIGLPVPRPPIQVVEVGGRQRVRGVLYPDQDYTEALDRYAGELPPALDGFLLKARSPSCGVGTTPLMDLSGAQRGTTSGRVAAALRDRFPMIPLTDESRLTDERAVEEFAVRVWLYRDWRRNPVPERLRAWRATLGALPRGQALVRWLHDLEATAP